MTVPAKAAAIRTRRWRGIPEGDGPPWTDLAVAQRVFGQFHSDLVGIVTGVNQHLRDVDGVRAFSVGASTCDTKHLIGERSTATNGGGALHEQAAVVAAIAESVERYSATYRPDHAIIQASWRALTGRGDNAVSPRQLRLFSDAQLAESGFPFVGFTDDLTLSWVPGVDLASGERIWLPASLVFLSVPPREPAGSISYGTSNGLAAGCTWDEAALSGLLELVERDGFCTVWHNGLSMPQIDPASDPEVSAFFDRHVRPAGLSLALVDLSGFGQVPSVLAVVRNEDNDIAPIGLGAAAAADPRRAIVKAVLEAFQTRAWMRAEQRDGTALPPDTDFTAEIRSFPDHIRLYSGPGLIEYTRFLDASSDRVTVGDLPPIDLFVVAERVHGLTKGMYHYGPHRNGLTPVREVDFEALCQATFRPELARDCAAMIVLGATFWRSRFKYGQRGLRFCLMEAGHLMQSLLLGTGYSLAVRPIGGFLDDDAASGMDFDGVNEAPLYLMLVGPGDTPGQA